MKKKIYYGYAVYDRKEINAVNEVLTKKNLTLIDGPSVKLFETNVANIFGKRFGLMVNSGNVVAGANNAFGTGFLNINGGLVDLIATSQNVTSLFGTGGTLNINGTLTSSSIAY